MEIVVVGGGISGLTVAATLAALGQRVRIVAEHVVGDPGARDLPLFASAYPAASVLPVSVGLTDIEAAVSASRRVFRLLERHLAMTVRRQVHFEVFEAATQVPELFAVAAEAVDVVEPSALSGLHPHGVVPGSAWCGTIGFVEVPPYVVALRQFLERRGVSIERRRLAPGELPTADLVVVCAGVGSPRLVDDRRPNFLLRGHLIHLDPPAVVWPGGSWASYHYTPAGEVFRHSDGTPGEIYFYPRRDVWVLGGTRQPGQWIDGDFVPDGDAGPVEQVGGVAVPLPMVQLHREVLRSWLGVDLDRCHPRARWGLRFVRDPGGEGIRLERTDLEGRPVICNYGHGGAGVTLSWGCAARVASLVAKAGAVLTPMRDELWGADLGEVLEDLAAGAFVGR